MPCAPPVTRATLPLTCMVVALLPPAPRPPSWSNLARCHLPAFLPSFLPPSFARSLPPSLLPSLFPSFPPSSSCRCSLSCPRPPPAAPLPSCVTRSRPELPGRGEQGWSRSLNLSPKCLDKPQRSGSSSFLQPAGFSGEGPALAFGPRGSSISPQSGGGEFMSPHAV